MQSRRRLLQQAVAGLPGLGWSLVQAQQSPPFSSLYVCPMDPGVQSPQAGKCPRCGMRLEQNLPTFAEFGLQVELTPKQPVAGQPVRMRFRVQDPRTGRRVIHLQEVHERLFHLFVVGQTTFAHEHPELTEPGIFDLPFLPKEPGLHRLFADFYPLGGLPQFVPWSFWVRPASPASRHARENIQAAADPPSTQVQLEPEPAQPIAGQRTLLRFLLEPGDGLQPWLGAAAHLFLISEELDEGQHLHPAWEQPADQVGVLPFSVLFPREGNYRLYLQFQRKNKLETHLLRIQAGKL